MDETRWCSACVVRARGGRQRAFMQTPSLFGKPHRCVPMADHGARLDAVDILDPLLDMSTLSKRGLLLASALQSFCCSLL